MNIEKFLKTPTLKNIFKQLLLSVYIYIYIERERERERERDVYTYL